MAASWVTDCTRTVAVLCAFVLAGCHGSDSGGQTAVRSEASMALQVLDPIEEQGSTNGDPTSGNSGSSGAVPLGFTIDFFGRRFDQLFISNNGYVTFGEEHALFTPYYLQRAKLPIIAPFFADADLTSGAGSVTHGPTQVNGRPAFMVTWRDVGYYRGHTDKRNTFQLALIDRSDVSAGSFDIELNYEQIQWETGDHSGGKNGRGSLVFPDSNRGGTSAHAGYSDGSGRPGTFLELPGSGVEGAFLDENQGSGLRNNSLDPGGVRGRYVFAIRSGCTITDPRC